MHFGVNNSKKEAKMEIKKVLCVPVEEFLMNLTPQTPLIR